MSLGLDKSLAIEDWVLERFGHGVLGKMEFRWWKLGL